MSEESTKVIEFIPEEVAEHNTKDSLYVSINGKVYDITKFIEEHPGGEEILLDEAGKDATDAFEDVGHSEEARELLSGFEIGVLNGQPPTVTPKTTPSYPNSPKVEPASYASYFLPFIAVIIYVMYKYITISEDSPK